MGSQLIQKESSPATFTQQQLGQWQQTHGGEQAPAESCSASGGGIVIGSDQHKNLFEHGQIEYHGRDSFSNIQAHLDSKLNK